MSNSPTSKKNISAKFSGLGVWDIGPLFLLYRRLQPQEHCKEARDLTTFKKLSNLQGFIPDNFKQWFVNPFDLSTYPKICHSVGTRPHQMRFT